MLHDFEMVVSRKSADDPQRVKNERLASLVLRVVGIVTGVIAACALVGALGTIAAAPLASVTTMILASCVLVIARDAIVMGNNWSNLNNAFTDVTFREMWRALTIIGSGIAHEVVNETSYIFQDTWIAGRVFKMFSR